jgi:hypothetical protein
MSSKIKDLDSLCLVPSISHIPSKLPHVRTTWITAFDEDYQRSATV